MKKAIVLLLALVVLGGAAFAQATVAVSLSGGVTLIDENTEGVFAPDGNGYDVITIKANKDGNFGFSASDQNLLDGSFDTLRDWNVYYKIFGGKAKVTFGNLRNGDIRMLLPNWNTTLFGATDRITGYGVLTNVYPMDGLTLAVNLPYGLTAEATGDVFQKIDLGAKYVIADVGTVIALANLNLVTESNIVNFGFTYSGMENLTATALYKGTFATTSEHKFAVGADYTVDAISAGLEFCGVYTDVLAWDLAAFGSYTISDTLSAGAMFLFDSESLYDASAYVDYDLGNGFVAELEAGYNADVYYNATLYYAIAF